jgi:CheY-like chemotaxis protein
MQKIRVLVADDEGHIRNIIGRIVKALGAEVVAEAGDGEQAARLFELKRWTRRSRRRCAASPPSRRWSRRRSPT